MSDSDFALSGGFSAALMLCDWADAIGGKLYIQGGGWTTVRQNTPATIAVAAVVRVPYHQTNVRHTVAVTLLDEDGQGFPAAQPFRLEMQVELGRPPGMRKGEESVVPLAARLQGVEFPPGGYRFEVSVNGDVVTATSFVSRDVA
ncbi:MAG TPA: hypothetical protein VF230_05885 [Acidimicrobiales bacterium]